MKKLLFALYLVYALCIALVFAPVTLVLALLAMTIAAIAVAWGRLFNVLTFGFFK